MPAFEERRLLTYFWEVSMEEPKNRRDAERPHGRRGRDQEDGRSKKRTDYAAGADGEQDVKAGPSEGDDLFRPDRTAQGGEARGRRD
jgi:hypothetical protein